MSVWMGAPGAGIVALLVEGGLGPQIQENTGVLIVAHNRYLLHGMGRPCGGGARDGDGGVGVGGGVQGGGGRGGGCEGCVGVGGGSVDVDV